jgi:two-component system, NarL family, invasion response regulator UvrY
MKIGLLDDCPLIRSAFKATLGSARELTLEWSTGQPADIFKFLVHKMVQLLVLEIAVEGQTGHGLHLLEKIRFEYPQIRLFVYTSCPDCDIPIFCYRLGTFGFLHKRSTETELLSALHCVAKGKKYIPQPHLERMALLFSDANRNRTRAAASTLSVREKQVLDALADGRTNSEIAKAFNISVQAASTYRARGLEKLALKSLPAYVQFRERRKAVHTSL